MNQLIKTIGIYIVTIGLFMLKYVYPISIALWLVLAIVLYMKFKYKFLLLFVFTHFVYFIYSIIFYIHLPYYNYLIKNIIYSINTTIDLVAIFICIIFLMRDKTKDVNKTENITDQKHIHFCGNEKMKCFKIFDLIAYSLPIISLLLIYLYFFLSWSILGFMPTPYKPDPKTAQLVSKIGFIYFISFYVMLSASVTLIVYPVLLPIRKFIFKESKLLKNILLYVGIWVFFIVWVYLDPVEIIEWYFD